MPASASRGGSVRRRGGAPGNRRSRPLLSAVALASVLFATAPARADATSLGSLALSWAETTAAHALKAAEPTNDLTVGGLAALNRSVRGSLDTIDHFAPEWLGVDLSLSFRRDFRPRYGVAATQPLARLGRDVLALRGRLDYEASGARSSRLGFDYRHRRRDDALEVSVQGGLDEQPRAGRDRYVVETSLEWAALDVHGTVFNEVAADPTPGADAFATWVDAYEIDLEARAPFLPWAGIRAHRSWQRRDGDQVRHDRISLRLRPITSFSLETGMHDRTDRARDWFARIRVKLEFGPS